MDSKRTIKPGDSFLFFGLKMVALDVDSEGITAITGRPVFDKAFDERDGSNWIACTLRHFLNANWLNASGIDIADLIKQQTEIIPDDTCESWGLAEDYVQLLTCEQYRKWRKSIPEMRTWWWTMTPFSCLPSYCYVVRLVNTSGALGSSLANYSYGVVPRLKIRLDSEAIKPIL